MPTLKLKLLDAVSRVVDATKIKDELLLATTFEEIWARLAAELVPVTELA
jgi:hypothetical protein